MTVQEKLFTAAELLTLPHDRHRYALIKGRLIEMSPTGKPHGLLVGELTTDIRLYVRQHQLGQVYGAETGFRLTENPDTVYGIDIAFVSTARAQKGDGYFRGAPDLAVEIISPGNTELEIHEKVTDYFSAGARLVWIIYPKSRVIYVYRSPDAITVLHESDSLNGDMVLPGFSLSIASLFAVLDE